MTTFLQRFKQISMQLVKQGLRDYFYLYSYIKQKKILFSCQNFLADFFLIVKEISGVILIQTRNFHLISSISCFMQGEYIGKEEETTARKITIDLMQHKQETGTKTS